ncbi:MAG: flippase-like domain-containing protein [Candidatus Cloacimonetes bacterium]|nr:flippase-like domain-containing protein [Candidatus Cloacimonadota bacterium]
MEKLITKRISFFLKLSLSALILWLIFRKIEFAGVVHNISSYSILTIISVLILAFLKHLTQYYNWKKFLQINPDFRTNEASIIKSYLIGLALRFVVPGGWGTFGKVYYVENTSKKKTAISVALEKVFGTWTIWFFAGWASVFYFKELPLILRLSVASLLTLFPFALYIAIISISKLKSYQDSYKKNAVKVIVSQIVYESSTFLQYWFFINTFVSITLFKTAYSTALILFSNTIPITFSGIGLRELFAINVLAKYGITSEVAVACAFSIFIFNDFIPALLGVYFIFQAKHKSKKQSQI